jgi:hypothetical protein
MDRQGLISCGRNLAPVVNDRRLVNPRLLHETGTVYPWGGDGVLLGLLLRYSPLALLASSVVVPLGFLFLRPSVYRALIVRCHGSGKEVLGRVFCVERKGCSPPICCCCFRSENFFLRPSLPRLPFPGFYSRG